MKKVASKPASISTPRSGPSWGVAGGERAHCRLSRGRGSRGEAAQRTEGVGLLPRFAVCRAKPEGVEEARAADGRVLDHPGAADLRVVDQVEVLAKRAVVVCSDRRGDEELVLPAHLLLQVHADRVVFHDGVGSGADPGSGHTGKAGRREAVTVRDEVLDGPGVHLEAQRCGGLQGLGNVPNSRCRVVEGAVDDRFAVLVPAAERRIRRIELRRFRAQEVVEIALQRVGHVEPEGEPVREPVEGIVPGGDPGGHPVRVVEVVVLLDPRFGCRPAEPPARIAGPQPGRIGVDRFFVGVVAGDPETDEGDAGVCGDLQILRRLRPQVDSAVVLLGPAVLGDPFVRRGGAADKVLEGVRAAGHVHAVVLRVRVAEHQVRLGLVFQDVERFDLPGVRVHAPVRRSVSGRILEPLRPLPHGEVPPGRPDAAALRPDVDDAVGGFGSVQRRRGGSLDHLDGLDHRGVHVVDARDVTAAALHPVAHAHSVDIDEGSVVDAAHGGTAADLDRGCRADVARALLHYDPWKPGAQKVGDVVDGLNFRDPRIENCDRVADLPHAARRRGPRHDKLVQLERLLAEEEVLDHALACRDGHRSRLGPVAEELHGERVASGRYVRDRVRAVGLGERAEVQPFKEDLGRRDGVARALVAHGAAHRLGREGARRGRDHKDESEQQACSPARAL